MVNVYVQGPAYYDSTARVFSKHGYNITDLNTANMVVLTGGEDIFPGLYGEQSISGVYYNRTRDERDLKTVDKAFKAGKFLVGICRGAQLLNCIPNGGSLWQHVDSHGGNNHKAFDKLSGTWKELISVHHQAMRVTDEAEIICWALESKKKSAYGDTLYRAKDLDSIPEKDRDMEVVFYPKTRSFCFQGHPEFGHPPTTKYFFDLLDHFYKGTKMTQDNVCAV